jgi:hypothetical protein
MNRTNDAIWLSFEALAKRYPHDNGVRITADLARWLLEERQRLNLPAPSLIEKVVRTGDAGTGRFGRAALALGPRGERLAGNDLPSSRSVRRSHGASQEVPLRGLVSVSN